MFLVKAKRNNLIINKISNKQINQIILKIKDQYPNK